MSRRTDRLAQERDQRERRWGIPLSLGLHALAILLLVLAYVASPLIDEHQNVATDDIAVVFETGQKTPPAQVSEDAKHRSVADAGTPGSSGAPASPAPPLRPQTQPPSMPKAEPTPPAPPPQLAPPTAAPNPSVSIPSAPLSLPTPPHVFAPPRPAACAEGSRAVPPSGNGFPAPMAFSFGGNTNAVSSRANGALVATVRPLGGASPHAAGDRDFLFDASLVSGADPGKDWFAELMKWWLQHRYYPDQAAKNLEQGDPGIRITVERNGHVRAVELRTRSGSRWLDLGAEATFDGAHLPAFPPQTQGDVSVIAINIHYYIVFR